MYCISVPINRCRTCLHRKHYFSKASQNIIVKYLDIQGGFKYCYKRSLHNRTVIEVAELLQFRLVGQSNNSEVCQESFKSPQQATFCATGAVWLCIVLMCFSPFLLPQCSSPFQLFSSLSGKATSTPASNLTWISPPLFTAVAILAASNGCGSGSSTNSSATAASTYRQPVKK